jgi:hypothetical protein
LSGGGSCNLQRLEYYFRYALRWLLDSSSFLKAAWDHRA